MKTKKNLSLIIFSLLLTFSLLCCHTDDDSSPPSIRNEGIKVLALGDSRVEGSRPDFESYRYEFWKNMTADNWLFDFIGPLKDLASYPQFMNSDFDFDHAGVGGFTTKDVLDNLSTTISTDTPDVVLLGIGGNDLLENVTVSVAIANINQIIDRLQAENNKITIFLEQIALGRSDIMIPQNITLFNSFNEAIILVGVEQTTADSKIVIVDMAINWSDTYMADDVHYNESGAKEVADRYFLAFTEYITR